MEQQCNVVQIVMPKQFVNRNKEIGEDCDKLIDIFPKGILTAMSGEELEKNHIRIWLLYLPITIYDFSDSKRYFMDWQASLIERYAPLNLELSIRMFPLIRAKIPWTELNGGERIAMREAEELLRRIQQEVSSDSAEGALDRLRELLIPEENVDSYYKKKTVTSESTHIKDVVCRRVVLTTGDEIDLADEEGSTHLFNGIIASVFDRLKDTDDFAEKGWPLINDVCLWELNYVAGQLRGIGSQMDMPFLAEQFGVQWDILAERFKSERDNYGEDEDDEE